MQKKCRLYELPRLESSIKQVYGGGTASIWDGPANLYRQYRVSCRAGFGTKREAVAFAREIRRQGGGEVSVDRSNMWYLEDAPVSQRTYVPGRPKRLRR